MTFSFMGPPPTPVDAGLRSPPLKTSLAMKKIDTLQARNWMTERTTSAWATLQTELRQKRSRLMKTARAMKPANQNRTLEAWKARAPYG